MEIIAGFAGSTPAVSVLLPEDIVATIATTVAVLAPVVGPLVQVTADAALD